VAVAGAIQEVSGLTTQLKWPNDILVSGKKVAGLLIETASFPAGEHAALMGVGINVNVAGFPTELTPIATSLQIELGHEVDMNSVERALCEWIDATRKQTATNGWPWLLSEWRSRDNSTERTYSILEGIREVVGKAIGVADDGSLLLQLEDGRQIATLAATSNLAPD
jgi:BirA family biotin operon repressor/biotin-[acetyl-CoA-carboxylase] ligase